MTERHAKPCQPGHTHVTASTNAGRAVIASPGVVLVRVAEAEGLEPPDRLRSLAFKLRVATYGSRHGMHYCWSRWGTSMTRTVVNRHE